MTERTAYLLKALRAQLTLSPMVTGLGLLGVGLGGLCLAALVIRGDHIPPEGSLVETATFNGSVGIFILTLAVLLHSVPWTARALRIWSVSLVVSMLYAFGIETVQAFRGLDPRFSRVAGPVDQALGGVFLLSALVLAGLFVVLAVKYFRAPPTPVVVGIRYGAVASFLAFGIGIWMSVVTQGRAVGESGNLLVLHAAGFHGLQAVPLVALLLQWSRVPDAVARQLVHVAGVTWLGACLAIAWQSGTGRAVVDVSAATLITLLCLVVFAITAVRAARAWVFSETFGPVPGEAPI